MATVLDQELRLEEISVPGYEKVLRVRAPKVGLEGIIAIHSLAMGPSLGGIRIYPYATFEAALEDVMRLSKGMTYKSAAAECGWGGGKSVIIANPKTQKTTELLLAFGQAVDRLKGEYICAEDVGCTPSDIGLINQATPYVVGLPGTSGNPSPFTAWGTYRGIQAVCKKLFGSDSVEGKTIAIQGLGSVGSELARYLFWEGARLILADIDQDKASHLAQMTGGQVVSCSEILSVECDVFAPCALGGILSEATIPSLRCKGIAGSANNQLLKDSDGDLLRDRGILYAPDFVTNSGGLINVSQELEAAGYHPGLARQKVHHIYEKLMVIFDIAENKGCSTHEAALSLVEYRLKYQIGKRVEPPYFHTAR